MFSKEYSKHYDLLNADKPYKKEIEFVYHWAGMPKSIFDIGCGTASYWKHYPDGTLLFGVDKSKHMARRQNIVHADISKYTHKGGKFDCATSLFDVLNYIPEHSWWPKIPLKKNGFFIFDIWDKEKIEQDGFRKTSKTIGDVYREIIPQKYDGKSVELLIRVSDMTDTYSEIHKMYLYSAEDIEDFCGRHFEIADIRNTQGWQTWYKCRRK